MRFTRAGKTAAAVHGMAVEVGDRFVTGANGSLTIALSDGSTLQLGNSSTLVLDQHLVAPGGTVHSTIGLLAGVLRSVVYKQTISHEDFRVTTPNAVAAARGTEYDVDYQDGKKRKDYGPCIQFTDVTDYRGTVVVTNPTNASGGSVTLHPGQMTTVACALAPIAAVVFPTTLIPLGYGAAAIAGLGAVGAGIAIVVQPPGRPASPNF